MVALSTVLDQIDGQTMLLPEFQRGYVWSRDQIRGLMRSMYLNFPVGSLLVWETNLVSARGVDALSSPLETSKQLLLDGQQRITSLYSVLRGHPPVFYEGEPTHFSGLHFNVDTEAFEFYAPTRMRGEPTWVSVTDIFTQGLPDKIRLLSGPEHSEKFPVYVERLMKLQNVRERNFYVETITGADKTIDVVVDIFNRVNSGGTKLSKGDLALARICSEWTAARPTMRDTLDRWKRNGFDFGLDWLLRNVNAVATGRAPFAALDGVTAGEFERALTDATKNIDHLLGLCVGRLGLDNDRVLIGRYAIPVLTRHLHNTGGRFAAGQEADNALFWLLQASLRGRFAGAAETTLGRDIETVDSAGIDGLLSSFKKTQRGGLRVKSSDFDTSGRGSRFFPMLYLLLRAQGARDLLTGVPIREATEPVVVLELFPRNVLTKDGHSRSDVGSITNLVLVTQSTAAKLPKRVPLEYLDSCDAEALQSQYIPTERSLWTSSRYRLFLTNRQKLLADAANLFFDELGSGSIPWTAPLRRLNLSTEDDPSDARQVQISSLVKELQDKGYASPLLDQEIEDPESGRVLAVAEAFWPTGLQAGQGSPVVLELDPEESDTDRLAELSYEVFTSVDALRNHVERRAEIASGERPDIGSLSASAADSSEEAPELLQNAEASAPVPAIETTVATAALRSADDLRKEVIKAINACVTELNYNPRYFTTMISQHGVIDSMRRILQAPSVSDGFVRLWEHGRLDLSVEAICAEEANRKFFTEQELETAHKRLAEFGYSALRTS